MNLVELTRPDFPFRDIHTEYIKPALATPTETQPARKPTQEELKNQKAAQRFLLIFRGIGLLFALLLLFAFGFSVGGFIITGLVVAFVLAAKPVAVTLTAYLTWLLTHFGGVGVFALTALPAAIVAILRQDVWLFLVAAFLLVSLIVSALASVSIHLFGTRARISNEDEPEELTPADLVAEKLPAILVDYYAPLSQFPRPPVLRSQFATPRDYEQAVADGEEQRTADRLRAVYDYIVSIDDEDGEDEGVVLVRLRVKDNRQNLLRQTETINDLLDAYGTRVVDTRSSGGSVLFRINTVQLPSEMEKLEERKTSTDFFSENASGKLLEFTAGIDSKNNCISLPLTHTLVQGLTGAGKGSVFRALVAHAAPYAKQGLIRSYLIDPKNGEAKAFKKVSGMFERIETESNAMADVVDEVYALMKTRQGIDDEWEISPENPIVLLYADEFLSLLNDPVFVKRKDEALDGMTTKQKLLQITAQGRSDRVFVIAATQAATQQKLDGLRDNFVLRILLRSENMTSAAGYFLGASPEDAQAVEVIAPSVEASGWKTSGIGYVKVDGMPGLTLLRFGFMDNAAFRELGEQFPQRTQVATVTDTPLSQEADDDEAVRLALENLS